VADPPYGSLSTTARGDRVAGFYNCDKFTGEAGLRLLYAGIIREAYRVLRKKGILILKCQDFVNNGKQNLIHVDLVNACVWAGFAVEDLFVPVRMSTPMMRHSGLQKHARKNHSFFLIMRKK
jgi:tRNA G10  N-methylase Trm11